MITVLASTSIFILSHFVGVVCDTSQAGEIEDRSEAWIRHMLLPQLPELPQNNAGLEKVLFPEQHRKLPVTKQTYKNVAAGMPELAAKFLIEADGSRLPSAVGTFLLQNPGVIVTEIQTTLLVAGGLNLFFELFKLYVGFLKITLSFNSTEKARNSFSQTTEPRTRPDTIATASGCTFLVGEDKVDNLHAAEGDLRSKMRLLNPMFYGELKFILGYIAAGTEFQWMYIGKNGPKEVYRVGRPLDLLNISDRCRFLLSVGYAFQLLSKMHDSIPAVPGRRAMFSMEVSPDGRRKIYFYDDKVAKHIRDFSSYSADQGTDITVIKRAYVAARTCRFLPQTVAEPIETAHGSYRVEFGPLGYECKLGSEEECRWMAQRVCQALCILHSEGLVHRDIRLPNIVRLSDTDFMLIDLESVADSPFILFDGFKPFSGWYPEMYEGNQYTPFSDMYSIGKLLDADLPSARTARAEDFIRKLTDKQLSSSQALQHPWLSELML